MERSKPSLTAFTVALTASVTCGFSFAQPALIQPAPCEAFVVKPLSETEPWHQVYFENRTDKTLHVFRISSDSRNKYPSTVLAPRHAEPRPGKSGAVWIVEDETGKCLASYTAVATGKNERAKIGDKDLIVRFGVPPYRLKVTLFPGFSVRPDREEVYIDSRDDAYATICEALNLWVGVSPDVSKAANPCGPPVQQKKESARHIVFDLNHPATSGVNPLGVVRDPNANLHVFFTHEHERHTTRNIQELQPGQQGQSDRVEFGIPVNGVPHIMLVGPWGPGEFNRRQIKPLHGEGSTRATVKRVSETVWEVQSAENSLGRLWSNADKANPVDLGLYRVSFRFRFELLPETAE